MVGGMDAPLELQAWVAMSTGTNVLIGSSSVTLRQLLNSFAQHKGEFVLINKEKQKRFQSYLNSGRVKVIGLQLVPVKASGPLALPFVFVQQQSF